MCIDVKIDRSDFICLLKRTSGVYLKQSYIFVISVFDSYYRRVECELTQIEKRFFFVSFSATSPRQITIRYRFNRTPTRSDGPPGDRCASRKEYGRRADGAAAAFADGFLSLPEISRSPSESRGPHGLLLFVRIDTSHACMGFSAVASDVLTYTHVRLLPRDSNVRKWRS